MFAQLRIDTEFKINAHVELFHIGKSLPMNENYCTVERKHIQV